MSWTLYVPLQIHLALSFPFGYWLQETVWHRCCPVLSMCNQKCHSCPCLLWHLQHGMLEQTRATWSVGGLQPMGQTLTSVELELMHKCFTFSSFCWDTVYSIILFEKSRKIWHLILDNSLLCLCSSYSSLSLHSCPSWHFLPLALISAAVVFNKPPCIRLLSTLLFGVC